MTATFPLRQRSKSFGRSAIIPALLLSGCAQKVWVKEGASQQDFVRDRYICERDMRQSSYYGEGLVGAVNMQGFFRRCMEAQGYTLESDGGNQTETSVQSRDVDADMKACKTQASSEGGNFANAFDECMRSKGL